jgi:hypothetical protein
MPAKEHEYQSPYGRYYKVAFLLISVGVVAQAYSWLATS